MQTVGQTDITRISFFLETLTRSIFSLARHSNTHISSLVVLDLAPIFTSKKGKERKMFREENNSDPIRQPFHSHFLVTAAMICGGLVMYPIGWDNREVRESCGKGANVYNLGEYIPFPPRKIVHFVTRVSLYVLPYRRGMEKES